MTDATSELQRLIADCDLSLRGLAREIGYDPSYLSKVLRGLKPLTPSIARRLDEVLGAGGAVLDLAKRIAALPQPAPGHRTSGEGKEPFAAMKEAVEGLVWDWDDDVWRREFLRSTGALAAASVAPIEAMIGGDDLIEAHNALRAAHGRLDNLRGAAAVYRQAVDHHEQIISWLVSARSARERQRIAALASDTGGFVGFLTFDLGRSHAALGHYRDAADYARHAGDLSSCANLVGQMSRIFADQGEYRRALSLNDSALRLAGTAAHPAVRSWLHAVRAHHHACLGDARSARTDLNTAWNILGRIDDGEIPTYISYLDAAEIGKWTGHTMIRLGQRNPSYLTTGKTALDDACAAWRTTLVRGSAELFTVTARTYAACGETDAAIDLAARSVNIATATKSARNLRAALTAQSTITARS